MSAPSTFQLGTIVLVTNVDGTTVPASNFFARGTVVKTCLVDINGNPLPATSVTNVHSYGATGNGTTDDTAAIMAAQASSVAAGGGVIYVPAGTYLISSSLPVASNVSWRGDGTGASVLKAAAGLSGGIFSSALTAGQTVSDAHWSDLAFDGVTGPTGAHEGIHLDSSATSSTVYYRCSVARCKFSNCHIGISYAGNNAASQNKPDDLRITGSYFFSNAVGVLMGGTYGLTVSDSYFKGHTIAGVGTSGFQGCPTNNGAGPDTVLSLSGLHIEGADYGSPGSESGILVAASQAHLSDLRLIYNSSYGLYFEGLEGEGNVLDGITVFGAGAAGGQGAAGIRLAGAGAGPGSDSGVLSNFVIDNSGNGSGTIFGSAIGIDSGSWMVSNGVIAGTAANTPGYAFVLGIPTAIDLGRISISNVSCPNTTSGFYLVNGTITVNAPNLVLTIKDCPGFNPVGAVTVAVPASGTAVAVVPYDRTVYVTAAAGGCTLAIQSGVSVVVPASTLGSVRIPAWKTLTPTYTTAPTWVVEGE